MGSWQIIKEYGKTTSFKGVARSLKAERIFQKVLWAIGGLIGMAIGTVVIYQNISNYLKYEISVSMAEHQTDEMPFPDITVCSLISPSLNEVLPGFNQTMSKHLELIDELLLDVDEQTQYDNEVLINLLKSPAGYYQTRDFGEAAVAKYNFVTDCTYNERYETKIPCERENGYDYVFNTVLSPLCVKFSSLISSVSEKEKERRINNTIGFQADLYLDDFSETFLEAIEMEGASFGRGVVVILHEPGTIEPLDVKASRAGAGFETLYRFDTIYSQLLSEPYNLPCTNEKYIDQDLATNVVYSENGCYDFTYQKLSIDKCGCINPMVMFTETLTNEYDFCGKITNNIMDTLENFKCILEFEPDFVCDPACIKYNYESDYSTTPWPHERYIRTLYDYNIANRTYEKKFAVYKDIFEEMEVDVTSGFQKLKDNDIFRRNFLRISVKPKSRNILKMMIERPAITLAGLAGTLGGSFNLWIGISFLTVIEIFDLTYLLIFQKREKKVSCDSETPVEKLSNDV